MQQTAHLELLLTQKKKQFARNEILIKTAQNKSGYRLTQLCIHRK